MHISFEPAYRQIKQAEKAFVDGYVSELEQTAVRDNVPLREVLARPVTVTDDRARAMLERPLVRAAIAERCNELSEAMEISAYRVLKELKAIAFSNIGDYGTIGEDGWFTADFSKCTPEQLSAIAQIKAEETFKPQGGVTRKIEFKPYDKLAGLDKFMRYMGLLEPENPYYREQIERMKKPGAVTGLVEGVSVEQAGEKWSQMING